MKDSLQAIYAEIPPVNCQRKCQEACGPILMSNAEMVIIQCVGQLPKPDPRTLTCSKLRFGSCSIYGMRPLICRLWASAEGMECPWGCKPEKYLTRNQAGLLLARADRLIS